MKRTASRTVNSPIGKLGLRVEDGFLTEIAFGGFPENAGEDPVLDETERQLRAYFSGARREFDLPVNPKGTEFQKKVWKALTEIPYGETCAYSEIAERIGSPKACRAVGMANHVNPIPIVVPCHRVVGKGGSLTGYAGGLDIKTFLLDLERETGSKDPKD